MKIENTTLSVSANARDLTDSLPRPFTTLKPYLGLTAGHALLGWSGDPAFLSQTIQENWQLFQSSYKKLQKVYARYKIPAPSQLTMEVVISGEVGINNGRYVLYVSAYCTAKTPIATLLGNSELMENLPEKLIGDLKQLLAPPQPRKRRR